MTKLLDTGASPERASCDVLIIGAGPAGIAAALAARSPRGSRCSASGQARAAFCGMGICHECRCTIDGLRRLACQTTCSDGMRIESEPPAISPGEGDD